MPWINEVFAKIRQENLRNADWAACADRSFEPFILRGVADPAAKQELADLEYWRFRSFVTMVATITLEDLIKAQHLRRPAS